MRGYSLSALVENLFKIVYPVGIYLDFDRVVDPNALFPGTTWVQVLDTRIHRGSTANSVGTAFGQIGYISGSDSVSIAIANLPAHSHTMNHTHSASSGAAGAYTTTLNFGGAYVDSGNNTGNQVPRWGSNKAIATAANHEHTITVNQFTGNTGASGSGTALSVSNPYRLVSRWKRTA